VANGDVRGVGGWLAFFLVTLGIINPLIIAVTGYQTLSDPQVAAAYGDSWPTLFNAELALIGVIVAMCWFACWRFLNRFNGTTVTIGLVTLWALAILTVFGEAFMVSQIAGIDFGELMGALAGPELIRPFIYATIWSLYLLISKRVKNTYRGGEAAGETFA
jgi:predicted membrane protein